MGAIFLPVAIVAIIGIVGGVILTVADKFMSVPVDERVTNVREVLPGANCGACGFAGCDEYAEKLVHEGAPANKCTPGGAEVAQKIGELLGVDAGEVVPMRAIVKCAGTTKTTKYIMEYDGPRTCEACNSFYQGRRGCSHGCLGYGDCVVVCQYDAIRVIDGVAVVDKELCTGCGMCSTRCPNQLIEVVPASSEVYVACSSHDTGGFVRKICQAGCIGCKKCEKTCEYGAIVVDGFLAGIDPQKCTNCGACIAACPTGVIRKAHTFEQAVAAAQGTDESA